MWKIQLAELNYNHLEVEEVCKIISSKWLTMGEKTQEFENNFSNLIGPNIKSLGVSSGTAALHLALLAGGIKKGDDVIVPALTFIADANVVKIVGANPIPADCDSMNCWNMSLDSIKRVITSNTKAIILVHYAGYPCEISEIVSYCEDRNIFLIEDVAHAPGAIIDGKKCGSFGDVGCFSFFSNKNLAVGEGGMLTTSSSKIYKKLKHLRSHGMSSLTLDRHKGRAATYDVIEPGLNYRIDEIRSALGCVQLDKLSDGNLKRKLLTERYVLNLKNSDVELPFLTTKAGSVSAHHIMPILLPKYAERISVIEQLKNEGIQSSIHYLGLWDFLAYEHLFDKNIYPFAHDICARELTLPLFPGMSLDQVDEVTTNLLKILDNYER